MKVTSQTGFIWRGGVVGATHQKVYVALFCKVQKLHLIQELGGFIVFYIIASILLYSWGVKDRGSLKISSFTYDLTQVYESYYHALFFLLFSFIPNSYKMYSQFSSFTSRVSAGQVMPHWLAIWSEAISFVSKDH